MYMQLRVLTTSKGGAFVPVQNGVDSVITITTGVAALAAEREYFICLERAEAQLERNC